MLYAGLAALEFGPSTGLGPGQMAGHGSADQISQIWWLAWAQFSLAHAHNPFFSGWQNAPIGLNAVVNTSMLGLGVLTSPITSIFGPIVSWNVLERAALVLSATSMCVVMRRWTDWWPASFIGGLLYGFSMYETTSSAHLFVVFVPLPPLFFLLLHEILVRQRWPASRVGALLGIICAAQYLISSEILASMVLLGAIGTFLFLLANRRSLSPMRAYAVHAGIAALTVGGVLLAGPVIYTLLGPGHLNGVPNSPANLAHLHGDVLATFVPGYFQWFRVQSLLAPYQLNSYPMYLGVPFILTVVLATLLLRRCGVVAMAGALAAISFLLSLGSTLYIDSHDTHIPLPFDILARLPIADGLLSTRFALYTALFGGAVVGIGVDVLHRRLVDSHALRERTIKQRRTLAVGVTIAMAIVVAGPLLPANAAPTTPTAIPAFYNSQMYAQDLPTGSTVLAYPYPDDPVFPGTAAGFSFAARYQGVNDALLDQAASGMRFRVIGGYGWRPDGINDSISPSALEPTSVKDLFDFAFYGQTTRPEQAKQIESTHLTIDIKSFLKKYNVSTVIVLPVGRDPAMARGALRAALGAPHYAGGVTVWRDVQDLLAGAPKPFRVTGSPPATKLLKPSAGSQIHGHHYLVASASGDFGVKSVTVELSGESSVGTDICRAVRFQYGWLCSWNSATVQNGTYTLRSIATDAIGQITASTGVVVHIRN